MNFFEKVIAPLLLLGVIILIIRWWLKRTSIENVRAFRKQAKINKEARRRMFEKFINKIFGGGKKS